MQSEISTAERLDAQLAIQEVRERALLWEAARGRPGWPGVFTGLAAVCLILAGIVFRIHQYGFAGFIGDNPGTFFIVLGLSVFSLNLWTGTQRKLAALRELLRQLERDRS